eukprot:CAMPEP_0202688600 /NCGR_PEP_ID=MMETSP1385-20130828/4096_1 /ASSEMBLY_ACC=CAM_ASM_000861 /TAXON_ID=933848 /ORGANISM="Elphidium margaritaceum" /LENGTH=416 /DNA_ID=CAMNT_0049343615 /DNA_START=86 /DNA_END=1336 /DNA_ORIENTATION=+
MLRLNHLNVWVLALLCYTVQSQYNVGPFITCFEQNNEVPAGFRDKLWQNESSEVCVANPDLCSAYKNEGPYPGKGDVCDHTDAVTGLTRNACYFNTIFGETINEEKTWSYKCFEITTCPLKDDEGRPFLGCKVTPKRISCWCQTDFCNGGDFIADNLAKWGNPDNYPANFDEICAYDWSGEGIYVDFSEVPGYEDCSNYIEPLQYAVVPGEDYEPDTTDSDNNVDTDSDTTTDYDTDTNADTNSDGGDTDTNIIYETDETETGTDTEVTGYTSTSTSSTTTTTTTGTATSISSGTSSTQYGYNDDDEAQLSMETCVIKSVSAEQCSCGSDCTAFMYSYQAVSVSKCGSLSLITGEFGASTCNPYNTVYADGDTVSCEITDCENGEFRILSSASHTGASVPLLYICIIFAFSVYFSL